MLDLWPFLDDDEAVDVDGILVDPYDHFDDDDEATEADGISLDPGITSDSSHMCESTWQIPSSTSGLRLR